MNSYTYPSKTQAKRSLFLFMLCFTMVLEHFPSKAASGLQGPPQLPDASKMSPDASSPIGVGSFFKQI